MMECDAESVRDLDQIVIYYMVVEKVISLILMQK